MEGSEIPAGATSVLDQDSAFSNILSNLSDICIVITTKGVVLSATARQDSPAAEEVSHWVGAKIEDLVDSSSARKLSDRVQQLQELAKAHGESPLRWAELAHQFRNGQEVPVRYAMHFVADADQILMLGQDQRPVIEMQQQLLNAQIALERDYEAQREIDTRYRILMDFTTDAIALVSAATGQIVDINHNAAALMDSTRSELVKTGLADHLTGQASADVFNALQSNGRATSAQSIEVEVKNSGRRLQLTGKLFRASGEQMSMVRLTDLALGSAGDGRLVANLRQLFQHGIDAIVFTDRDGSILAASETFLNLTDAPSPETVRGRSVSDFMGRGAVDLRVLLDNARRAGHLRMYATKIKTDFGAQLPVEISATWLDDQFDPVLALVIRNAANASTMRVDTNGQDNNMQNVIELVGSSTLKDIVSETTDVIEKICIETAIELTRNNRVAAAEMLGLSRQSLYVKLRKYGLLSREET